MRTLSASAPEGHAPLRPPRRPCAIPHAHERAVRLPRPARQRALRAVPRRAPRHVRQDRRRHRHAGDPVDLQSTGAHESTRGRENHVHRVHKARQFRSKDVEGKNEKSKIEKAPQADNNPKLNAFKMHQNDFQKHLKLISKLKKHQQD